MFLCSGRFESTEALTLSYRLVRHLTPEARIDTIPAMELMFQQNFE